MESVILGMVLLPGYPVPRPSWWRVGVFRPPLGQLSRAPGAAGDLRQDHTPPSRPPLDPSGQERCRPVRRPGGLRDKDGAEAPPLSYGLPDRSGFKQPPRRTYSRLWHSSLVSSADRARCRVDLSGGDRPRAEQVAREGRRRSNHARTGHGAQAGGKCVGLSLVVLRGLHRAVDQETDFAVGAIAVNRSAGCLGQIGDTR